MTKTLNGVPTEIDKVCVVGAGPIGCATAGYLSQKGFKVSIYDINPEAVKPIGDSGVIRLTGVLTGIAPIQCATDVLSEALIGAKLVILAIPASGHEEVAAAAASSLEPGALLVIQPGQTFSAISFVKQLRQSGFKGDLTPVETLNTLFTARLTYPGTVEIYAVKGNVGFAALPASRTSSVAALLCPLFRALRPCANVLEVGLHNLNAVLHPPITLLNCGMIDRGSPFLFYFDGATKHCVRVIEQFDRERCLILDKLGLEKTTLKQWFNMAYQVVEPTLHDCIHSVEPYSTIAAPTSLDTRLLLEDIPTGLVPYCSLAELVGVEVPVMRSFVELCSKLYSVDFWSTGRTLSGLGLGQLSVEELFRYVNDGLLPC